MSGGGVSSGGVSGGRVSGLEGVSGLVGCHDWSRAARFGSGMAGCRGTAGALTHLQVRARANPTPPSRLLETRKERFVE